MGWMVASWIGLGLVLLGSAFGILAVRRRLAARPPLPEVPEVQIFEHPRVRFVGGAEVPGQFERVDSTYPLGILELFGGSAGLTLHLAWTGSVPVHLSREDIVDVYPAAGHAGARGLAFVLCDGDEWYFWTDEEADLLKLLASLNYPVTWGARRRRTSF